MNRRPYPSINGYIDGAASPARHVRVNPQPAFGRPQDHPQVKSGRRKIRANLTLRATVVLQQMASRRSIVACMAMLHLMGAHEIRVRLGGISRQRTYQLTRRADFPSPVADLQAGKVWRAEDVEA